MCWLYVPYSLFLFCPLKHVKKEMHDNNPSLLPAYRWSYTGSLSCQWCLLPQYQPQEEDQFHQGASGAPPHHIPDWPLPGHQSEREPVPDHWPARVTHPGMSSFSPLCMNTYTLTSGVTVSMEFSDRACCRKTGSVFDCRTIDNTIYNLSPSYFISLSLRQCKHFLSGCCLDWLIDSTISTGILPQTRQTLVLLLCSSFCTENH